jgi:hypothetical protein
MRPVNEMKWGKRLGRVGFVIGFLGPVLFYAAPGFTYESHFLCPWCPYIDIFPSDRLAWLSLGLSVGLFCGLILALVGFIIGYAVSKVIRAN